MIGDGDPFDVTPQVADQVLGTFKRAFGVQERGQSTIVANISEICVLTPFLQARATTLMTSFTTVEPDSSTPNT
jgi:hypothetical protein